MTETVPVPRLSSETALLGLVMAKVLGDRLAAAGKVFKASALPALGVGDRVTVRRPDGTLIDGAKVTKASGKTTLCVTDERALIGWIRAHAPSELDTSPRVRESYLKALGDKARKRPDGVVVDERTGEVVPGLELVTSDPYLTPAIDPAVKEMLFEAMRSGQLSPLALLADLTTDPDPDPGPVEPGPEEDR